MQGRADRLRFLDKTPEIFDFGVENWVDRLCPAGYNKSIIAKSLNMGILAFQKSTNSFLACGE